MGTCARILCHSKRVGCTLKHIYLNTDVQYLAIYKDSNCMCGYSK